MRFAIKRQHPLRFLLMIGVIPSIKAADHGMLPIGHGFFHIGKHLFFLIDSVFLVRLTLQGSLLRGHQCYTLELQ